VVESLQAAGFDTQLLDFDAAPATALSAAQTSDGIVAVPWGGLALSLFTRRPGAAVAITPHSAPTSSRCALPLTMKRWLSLMTVHGLEVGEVKGGVATNHERCAEPTVVLRPNPAAVESAIVSSLSRARSKHRD